MEYKMVNHLTNKKILILMKNHLRDNLILILMAGEDIRLNEKKKIKQWFIFNCIIQYKLIN